MSQILEKRVRVVTPFGAPLDGVNISFPVFPNGTATDANGWAKIKALGGDQLIRFSYLGFATRNIKFNDVSETVVLEEVGIIGDEVIIVVEKPKEKTPWYVWAGLGIGVLGLFLSARSDNSTESNTAPGLKGNKKSKPKKIKAKGLKQPLAVTI